MGGFSRMVDRIAESGSATGEHEVDRFLRDHEEALYLGILFDQQIRAEQAFSGPYNLHNRWGTWSFERIANTDVDELGEVFGKKPVIHRFYNKMAQATHNLATYIMDNFDGDSSNIWKGSSSIFEFQKRAHRLPGFGKSKVGMFPGVWVLFEHVTPLLSVLDEDVKSQEEIAEQWTERLEIYERLDLEDKATHLKSCLNQLAV